MGRFRLSILVLCQEKREHQLPLIHSQTGRRVHTGLHTQVRASRPADRCIQYGCGLAKLQKKLWADHPILPVSIPEPPPPPPPPPQVTMEELYRRADKFSTLEDNIQAASQTVMITAQNNKPAAKGPFE